LNVRNIIKIGNYESNEYHRKKEFRSNIRRAKDSYVSESIVIAESLYS